jgi:hypothetical protein
MRRRTLLVALAGLAVVVAVGVAALSPRPAAGAQLTRVSFLRLKKGMTLTEANAILGPTGDHSTGEAERSLEG